MELLVVIGWVLMAVMIGYAAYARGRVSVNWLLVSLILSPVIAWMFLLLLPMRYHVTWVDQHGKKHTGWMSERDIREQELNRQ